LISKPGAGGTNDKGFVIRFVLAVVLLSGAFYSYFARGTAPVATADPPMLMVFEKKLANKALNAHIEKQQVVPSPVAADEPNFLAGATPGLLSREHGKDEQVVILKILVLHS
jgi:hypothetical protein